MKLDRSALDNRMKQLDDPWYTPGDTCLDTSGLSPEYKPKTVEDTSFDVPLVNGVAQSRAAQLHSAMLADPDILKELAAGNRTEEENELISQYGDSAFTFYTNGYKVSAKWKRNTWDCFAINEDNGDRTSFKLGGRMRFDKDGVMGAATRYLVPKEPWRKLTAHEEKLISYIAAEGTAAAIQTAADTYCGYALDIYDEDDRSDKMSDPRFMQLLEEATWFAFIQGRIDLDDEDIQWMSDKLQGRTATVNSLFACYELLDKSKSKISRGKLFNPDPEPVDVKQMVASFDEMSNADLAKAYNSARRLQAQEYRSYPISPSEQF